MANVHVRDGYVRIANDLFEAIFIKAHLTQRQLIVISFIIRQTYGWQRKSHDMSYQFIANGTGIARRHVIVTVRELETAKIITVDRSQNRNIIGINKNTDEWQIVTKSVTSRKNASDQFGQQLVTKSVTSTSDQIGDRKKDRQLKTEERKTDSYEHFDFLWSLYPRKLGKNSVTKATRAEVERNADAVRRAIERYKAEIERQHTEERFILYGSTFFNGRWRDYAEEEAGSGDAAQFENFGGESLE